MTQKAAFTPEEWTLLRIVPSLVSGGVSAADAGGIISAFKEAAAGMKAMYDTLHQSNLELMKALFEDRSRPDMPDPKGLLGEGSREQQIANFKAAVVDQINRAVSILGQKAMPEEALAYKQMLMQVAERAANAASEGGFLGFGGVRVSDAEKAFLTELSAMLKMQA
jgi:hypothetical protein